MKMYDMRYTNRRGKRVRRRISSKCASKAVAHVKRKFGGKNVSANMLKK